MLTDRGVVFLLDVDNTLLDNDRFGSDLGARLAQLFANSTAAAGRPPRGGRVGWHRYVRDTGEVLCVERFGASAPPDVLLREPGFSVDEVCRRALALRRA